MRALWVYAVVAAAGAAMIASPVTAQDADDFDTQFNEKTDAFNEWYGAQTRETYDAEEHARFARELLADLDFSQLSVQQLQQMSYMIRTAEDLKAKVIERADVLSADETTDGAVAAALVIQLAFGADTERMTTVVRRALSHPKIVDVIVDGTGAVALGYLSYLEPETLQAVKSQILALADPLFEAMPASMGQQLVSYYEAVAGLGLEKEQLEAMRQRTVDWIGDAVVELNADTAGNGDRLENSLAFLDGANARGELIDHPSPELTFSWTSFGDEVTTMADLKGKVVVVDFWATWCGPCVASFPNLIELQERYNGYDVVIVGVTSIQGRHIPKDGDPIDCEGDPEREYALMSEFMESHGMTWQVAFSEQEVFNPDYGVRGIPHVAIIDAEGRVRFNGLHPMDPLPEKAAHIDELLTEAGLPAPAPLTADASDDDG